MNNATTTEPVNETAPWRSPKGQYAVRWVHLSIGWRFWAFNRVTDEDVGDYINKRDAIRACLKLEGK